MEHRCSPRIPLDCKVMIFQYANPVAVGRIKNATRFGFYIESELVVNTLQQLTLEIMMYRQPYKLQKYTLEAIVAHSDDHGFGVELEQLTGEQSHMLQDFLIAISRGLIKQESSEMSVVLAANG